MRAHSQVLMVKTMVPGLSSVATSSFTFANKFLAPGESPVIIPSVHGLGRPPLDKSEVGSSKRGVAALVCQ